MRKFVIEREIPGVGAMTDPELATAAKTSNAALAELGKDIQWVQSYVADDRTFCIYLAKSVDLIYRHAELSGFPATRVVEIKDVIDPATESRTAAKQAA
jgi:hypothetical protein